jgi:tRNA A37 threonylcarbamoyladenosine synthetase subunit TsaC/SUA5/YrdC
VLCELPRTDGHRLRVLVPDTDETKTLRQLTAREDLVGARVALANQLRSQVEAFWPGAARIFADVSHEPRGGQSGGGEQAATTIPAPVVRHVVSPP